MCCCFFCEGQTFALLVQRLCSSDHEQVDLHENITRSPVLIKQLALLMDFALKFDDLKVSDNRLSLYYMQYYIKLLHYYYYCNYYCNDYIKYCLENIKLHLTSYLGQRSV